MADKEFFWNVQVKDTQYWKMIMLWIKQEDIDKLEYNDKWYANIAIKKSKNWNYYWEVLKDNNSSKDIDTGRWEEDLPF